MEGHKTDEQTIGVDGGDPRSEPETTTTGLSSAGAPVSGNRAKLLFPTCGIVIKAKNFCHREKETLFYNTRSSYTGLPNGWVHRSENCTRDHTLEKTLLIPQNQNLNLIPMIESKDDSHGTRLGEIFFSTAVKCCNYSLCYKYTDKEENTILPL